MVQFYTGHDLNDDGENDLYVRHSASNDTIRLAIIVVLVGLGLGWIVVFLIDAFAPSAAEQAHNEHVAEVARINAGMQEVDRRRSDLNARIPEIKSKALAAGWRIEELAAIGGSGGYFTFAARHDQFPRVLVKTVNGYTWTFTTDSTSEWDEYQRDKKLLLDEVSSWSAKDVKHNWHPAYGTTYLHASYSTSDLSNLDGRLRIACQELERIMVGR